MRLKKQISLILILSFLSFIPNFLYNKDEGVFAGEDPCEDVSCPPGCPKPEYEEKTDTCSCINCEIPCKAGTGSFENKSCQPLAKTGEWTCGVEIPIGEVMDRTVYSAEKMLAEFEGMIEAGREMADKADELLTDYKDWNCQDWCQTGCYKSYHITAGVLKTGQDPRCPTEARFVPRGIYAGDECKADVSQCKSCDDCGERCCWTESSCWDSEKEEIVSCPTKPKAGIETLTCKYCRKEGFCKEMCSSYSCWGCCNQYFSPIINAYSGMEELQKALTDDIEETNVPEKFRRSYILEQLDFARCELAKCWIPAEDYPDVLEGEKVGKHLLTCEQVSQMGLFDDDQIASLSFQIEEEEKETEGTSWWQVLVDFFQDIWQMLVEWFDYGEEEGCYPTNYYCCQM